jgi:hypothetical protein
VANSEKPFELDINFIDAVNTCGERALELAMKQGEPKPAREVDRKSFLWGFWFGASYERGGLIEIIERCRREHHVENGAPPAHTSGRGDA